MPYRSQSLLQEWPDPPERLSRAVLLHVTQTEPEFYCSKCFIFVIPAGFNIQKLKHCWDGMQCDFRAECKEELLKKKKKPCNDWVVQSKNTAVARPLPPNVEDMRQIKPTHIPVFQAWPDNPTKHTERTDCSKCRIKTNPVTITINKQDKISMFYTWIFCSPLLCCLFVLHDIKTNAEKNRNKNCSCFIFSITGADFFQLKMHPQRPNHNCHHSKIFFSWVVWERTDLIPLICTVPSTVWSQSQLRPPGTVTTQSPDEQGDVLSAELHSFSRQLERCKDKVTSAAVSMTWLTFKIKLDFYCLILHSLSCICYLLCVTLGIEFTFITCSDRYLAHPRNTTKLEQYKVGWRVKIFLFLSPLEKKKKTETFFFQL